MKKPLFFRMLIALFLQQFTSQQASPVTFIFQAPGRNWTEEFELAPGQDIEYLAPSIVDNLAGINGVEGYEGVTQINLSCDLDVTPELAQKITRALGKELGLTGWTFQAQFNQEERCEEASFRRTILGTPAPRATTPRLRYHFDFEAGEGSYTRRAATSEEEEGDYFPIYGDGSSDEDIEEDGEEEEEYSDDEGEDARVIHYIRRAVGIPAQ